jgi:two-component system sensor histidine kinase KdpD
MDETRHEPDEVLDQYRTQVPAGHPRGKLKIFFGYAAGVGKTYAMLEAARAQAAAGVDLAVGYVEPHSRPETESLLLGLELLPIQQVKYRDITLREFDLDSALARKPGILIVDELAHTNAPGLRHAKRWQDVEELLEAGINVYTTLNVQHVESLNDVVAQVSGIQVRETIPDSVFDQADSIELVDLPPEELLERFREGKVYVPAKTEQAMQSFFKLPNLIALREIALRRTAERVGAQMQTARMAAPEAHIWPTSERLLVCISSSPTSARVIRVAKRMASSLQAPWIAAHVERPGVAPLSDAQRQRLTANERLAEQLGAETITLSGENMAEELVSYAHARNVTKIVIGKTGQPRWREMLGRSVVADLLRRSGDIDVYVIRGKEEPTLTEPAAGPRRAIRYGPFLWSLLVVTGCALVSALLRKAGLSQINQVMVYLLGVVFVAVKWGRGPAIVASFASVLVFDFFFVPPYLTFNVTDTEYFITFAVMLIIALLISALTSRIRSQAEASRQRERRLEALYSLGRGLAGVSGLHQMAASAETQLAERLASEVALFLPDAAGRIKPIVGGPNSFADDTHEQAVAQWSFEHGKLAGSGTDTLPEAQALYVPLVGPQGSAGVLGVRSLELGRFGIPEQRQLLEAMAGQVALALSREQLAEQARRVLVQVDTERLRSSLLSAVSHDLRTPLAVIAGSSSSLQQKDLDEVTRQELLQTIVDESHRLARLVENLLNITRFESGAMVLNKQWCPLEEVVGSAMNHMAKAMAQRAVAINLPSDLPLVSLDDVLIEQVLINLLDNAAKYTPPLNPIDVAGRVEEGKLIVEVSDRGPGLIVGEDKAVFQKFYRGQQARQASGRGAGLGLAICRAIVEAHGGKIWAENRPGGGASFIFSVPMEGTPPEMPISQPESPKAASQP